MTKDVTYKSLGDEYPSVSVLCPTLSQMEMTRCSVWKSCFTSAGCLQPAAGIAGAGGSFFGPAGTLIGWGSVTLAGCGSGMFYGFMNKITGSCDDHHG